MKGKILLPLDISKASFKAYLPAKSLAEALDISLCFLHISNEKFSEEELLKKIGINPEELKCFVFKHEKGNVEEIILTESEQCEYIVMGTHGKTCDETIRMGSTTAQIIQSSNKPVLLIKPNANLTIKNKVWRPQKALIPLNGTPGTSEALLPAMNFLIKINAYIDVLHISGHKEEQKCQEGEFSAPYYEDYPQLEWPSWGKEFAKRFCPSLKSHIKMNVSLSHGDPADEIITFAQKNKNDFIAIVWHGTMAHLRAKTLKKIIEECNCPLMLIKVG